MVSPQTFYPYQIWPSLQQILTLLLLNLNDFNFCVGTVFVFQILKNFCSIVCWRSHILYLKYRCFCKCFCLKMTEMTTVNVHISLLFPIYLYIFILYRGFSVQSFIDIHHSYISLRGMRQKEARWSFSLDSLAFNKTTGDHITDTHAHTHTHTWRSLYTHIRETGPPQHTSMKGGDGSSHDYINTRLISKYTWACTVLAIIQIFRKHTRTHMHTQRHTNIWLKIKKDDGFLLVY